MATPPDRSAAPSTSGLWAFLNSGFGLWCLSSLLVGLVTWSYTRWHEAQARREVTESQIRKLDTELAYRFLSMKTAAAQLKISREELRNNAKFNDDPKAGVRSGTLGTLASSYQQIVQAFRSPEHQGADGIFPEFRERDALSLLQEEAFILDSNGVAPTMELQRAINTVHFYKGSALESIDDAAAIRTYIHNAETLVLAIEELTTRGRYAYRIPPP